MVSELLTVNEAAAALRMSRATLYRLKAAILTLDAQLLDLATWLLAVRAVGIGGEANPIAVAAGPELVIVGKVAGAILLALLAARLAPSRWALLPAIVGVFGAVTNVMAVV